MHGQSGRWHPKLHHVLIEMEKGHLQDIDLPTSLRRSYPIQSVVQVRTGRVCLGRGHAPPPPLGDGELSYAAESAKGSKIGTGLHPMFLAAENVVGRAICANAVCFKNVACLVAGGYFNANVPDADTVAATH